MAVRKLSHNASMDLIWEELVYTESRLLADERARDLAPEVARCIAQVEQTHQEQRQVWRVVIQAHARVDAADDGLDDAVGSLGRTLVNVVRGDRKDPRFLRYFKQAPSVLIRRGLESELARVGGWPTSLQAEAEPALQAEGRTLGAAVGAGQAAIEARTKAEAARADHRVRHIVRLIDDVNGARLSLWGELAKRAARLSLPRDWPDRFFLHQTRSKPADLDAPAPEAATGA